MSRIAALGVASKKKSLPDSQRTTPRVKQLRAEYATDFVQVLDERVKHLIFIDEMGTNLGMTCLYGRAAPGQRVVESTPGHSGANYTTIAALGWYGIQAPWVIVGALDATTFEGYIELILAPTLRRGDIVILDNLSAHKGWRTKKTIRACGAQVQFLPPYSSDLNPIELGWSKVKTALRILKARTQIDLVEALAVALRSVSRLDVQAWLTHCGYLLS